MDILEKLFEKVSKQYKKNKEQELIRYSATFEDNYHAALVFAQSAAGNKEILLKYCDRGLGVVFSDGILLPKKISLFKDPLLNRDILLHKALVAGVIFQTEIRSIYPGPSCILEKCLEIHYHKKTIQNYLEQQFPTYQFWSEELRKQIQIFAPPSITKSDQLWAQIEIHFANYILNIPPPRPLAQIIEDFKLSNPQLFQQKMEAFPEHSLALWCELTRSKQILGDISSSLKNSPKKESSKNKKTVQQKNRSDEIKVVDLEKEKQNENPVTHSFEKLETADEYQGGYRHADGGDDLMSHQDALDELNLKHVTRGGEAAESIFQADISDLVETSAAQNILSDESTSFISLPEWDYRQNNMAPNYCRLFLHYPQPEKSNENSEWLQKLLAEHSSSLNHWKQRLESLVNQRSWIDRQWEGSEISIDAFVRYHSDTQNSGSGDARLFLRSVHSRREFSALVLVDQSLSTDSWIMNRRVLDIELQSLAFMSYLIGELKEPIAVAGTYSQTRHHCSFNIYKDFDDDWNQFLLQIPKIEPTGYTRLGPAIRHATELLIQKGGRQKLLILLTDGKPTDYDRYEGRYGIEDIRHANMEARQRGVQVRALAIDSEAKHYFPHLFGKNEYQIISNPAALPEALFRIYFESTRG
jgi:nitric oxide reductase NorD protein